MRVPKPIKKFLNPTQYEDQMRQQQKPDLDQTLHRIKEVSNPLLSPFVTIELTTPRERAKQEEKERLEKLQQSLRDGTHYALAQLPPVEHTTKIEVKPGPKPTYSPTDQQEELNVAQENEESGLRQSPGSATYSAPRSSSRLYDQLAEPSLSDEPEPPQ